MKCPACNHDATSVKDSRPTETSSIRRRRTCDACSHRWTTWELVAPPEADLEAVARKGLTMALDSAGQLVILGNWENLQRVLLRVREEVDVALNDISAMADDPIARRLFLS